MLFRSGLLHDCVAVFEAAARHKHLQLESHCELGTQTHYRVDPLCLRQLLSKLIDNAIKFSHEGKIQVALDAIESDADSTLLEFSVSDTGIGIAAEQLDAVFERFKQLDGSRTRRYGGSGLGLAIACQLAQRMGGELGVNSEPGRGSRFWFRLRAPRAASQPAQIAQPVLDLEQAAKALGGDQDLLRTVLASFHQDFSDATDRLSAMLAREEFEPALLSGEKNLWNVVSGIAGKLLPALHDGPFLEAFNAKAEHAALAARMPIHVISDPALGLHGAFSLAGTQQLLLLWLWCEGRHFHLCAGV